MINFHRKNVWNPKRFSEPLSEHLSEQFVRGDYIWLKIDG